MEYLRGPSTTRRRKRRKEISDEEEEQEESPMHVGTPMETRSRRRKRVQREQMTPPVSEDHVTPAMSEQEAGSGRESTQFFRPKKRRRSKRIRWPQEEEVRLLINVAQVK